MHRATGASFPANQTAGAALVIRVILKKNTSTQRRAKILEREIIRRHFAMPMNGEPDGVMIRLLGKLPLDFA